MCVSSERNKQAGYLYTTPIEAIGIVLSCKIIPRAPSNVPVPNSTHGGSGPQRGNTVLYRIAENLASIEFGESEK